MSKPLRIGLAGLGTVGAAVARQLLTDGARLTTRAGRPLTLTAVAARDRFKDRGLDLSDVLWFDDAVELARSGEVDVVVELIGGAEGSARATVEAGLAANKPVVTANKALLAAHHSLDSY